MRLLLAPGSDLESRLPCVCACALPLLALVRLLLLVVVLLGPSCRFGVGDTSGIMLTMPGRPGAYGSRITFSEVHLWQAWAEGMNLN